jgi:NitT/TauT family transport system substrate-binding protein
MNFIKHALQAVPVVAVGVLLAGCGGSTPPADTGGNGGAANTASTPPATEKLDKVTVGYTPTIVLPQPLIGTQEGQYEKLIPGVKFEQKVYNAGSGVVEALRAGTIDIGFSGPFPALKAFAKAGDIVLLAGAGTGGTQLMVLKNSPIKTLADLKGKKIGVNQLGSTVDSFVRHNLIKAGLKPDTDVKIQEVPPGEQAAQLQGGQVAAVAAPAPWPSQVEAVAGARALLSWKAILGNGTYSSGSAYTTKKFADAHPDIIKQFLSAHKTITDDLNKDRATGDKRVLAAWSKVSKKTLKPEVARAAFATIKYSIDPDAKGLQEQADIALETGGLKKKANLAGFVYEVQ